MTKKGTPNPGAGWNFKASGPRVDVAEVRRLAAQRLPASVIGERMGRSRNAIVGVCHRNKIQLQGRPGRPPGAGGVPRLRAVRAKAKGKPAPAPARPAPRPRGAPAGNRNLAAWGAARKVAARSTPPPLPPATRLARPKSIAAVGFRDCRYIGARPELVTVDTPIFCGRRAREHSSYCEEHHALCWTRPTGRRAGLPPAAAGKPPM
jgi:hypothetical protein